MTITTLLADTVVVPVDDLAMQLLSTTGPIGTLLVGGFVWARGKLARIEEYGHRLTAIEVHLGIHPYHAPKSVPGAE